jgi:hypothetical protein
MSNFLKKGKRSHEKMLKNQLEKTKDKFLKALIAMNQVFLELKDDPTLTHENFDERVKAITSFKFSDKQLDILSRDIFNYESEKIQDNA